MNILLNIIILIPLAGFLISLVIPGKREAMLSWAAYATVGTQLVFFLAFMIFWSIGGFPVINLKDLVLFKAKGYEFFIDFMFDKITAVYALVGSVLTSMIMVYSRTYLHRESGYKRFFNTTILFYFGYTVVIFAGNLETLFAGWELLGISSFLLIAFYRYRYLPVKNAIKVFTIYRIGDVGLLLAMWMSHHLWQENITFEKLGNYDLVHAQLQSHTLIGVFISLMILISAAAKSAQLPFSSWLPRAMEGPTPSTAIFYGSLAVHVGVFLLMRTFHFWEHQVSVRILIVILGFITSIVATGIARVQSSVKSQIAYSSIAQIGLIFIEVAFGWINIALIHFAGNAFLRTYQLLVSPSVVTYLIREQFYNFVPREHTFEDSFPKKLEYSLYVLSLKEWNLDSFIYRYFWNPLKWAGKKINFMTFRRILIFGTVGLAAGAIALYRGEEFIPTTLHEYLPVTLSVIALMFVLKAFTERKHVQTSWVSIIMNHFFIALAVSFNEHFDIRQTFLYLSGIVVFGIIGFVCLRLLKTLEIDIDLDRFHGHSYMYPALASVFLISCLGVAGFPITPTFIGEDLIFSHIHEDQVLLAFFVALSYVLDGLALIRMYSRIFLGPHVRSVYEMAYRSS